MAALLGTFDVPLHIQGLQDVGKTGIDNWSYQMDRLDTMLAFTRVVELQSFTKAAASLNVPKGTVSAQVCALENRLRVRLLQRTTRHVRVTPDGAAYYERIIRLLDELREAEGAVSSMAAAASGKLRIAVPGPLGRRVIIPAVHQFLQRYPDIELEINLSDRQFDLLQEGIDCVVQDEACIDESLIARTLESFALVTCASPAYLQKHGMPQDIKDLENHWTVNYVSPQSGKVYPLIYNDGAACLEINGRARIAIDDADGCVAAASAGVGVAQLPDFVVRESLLCGRLVQLLPLTPKQKVKVSIAYPRYRHTSARLKAFIDWAVETFSQNRKVIGPERQADTVDVTNPFQEESEGKPRFHAHAATLLRPEDGNDARRLQQLVS